MTVAVINVGGVAFPPFVELFGPERLPYRCVVLSDGDPPARPDAGEEEGAEPIKPRVAARLAKELADPAVSAEERADRILAAVKDVKGRFAQELAGFLDESDVAFAVPSHIRDAIEWVAR